MNKQSLQKAKEIIINSLEDASIDTIDKMELINNLWHFLNEENYKSNVEVLKQHQKKLKK
jgi:hypothetical protein